MYLSKLPSGHWRVAVKYRGQRKTATAPTRTEARLLGHELELELGAKRRPADMTVGDLLDMHLLAVKDIWSPTTRHDAIAVADKLPAVFRQRLVADIDPPVIAALYRELTRNNWSPHRLRRVRLVISTAFATAIEHRLATHNPTRDARPPRLPHRAITPPDQQTVEKILAHTTGQFEVFLRLAAATGARRGELVALRWTDLTFPKTPESPGDYSGDSVTQTDTSVDADVPRRGGLGKPPQNTTRSLVHITRALVCTTDGIEERDTKTAVKGHRTIKLGDSLTKRLLEHRDIQQEKAAGDVVPVWVFSHSAGAAPWRPDYTSREFARVCKKAGVTGVRLHDLRHFLATDQLSKGRPMHRVSQRLGHSSTATTQRTYSHWVEEDDDMADDIDEQFG